MTNHVADKVPDKVRADIAYVLLISLVFTLVFEGFLRRAMPIEWNLPLFFFKDVLCVSLWVTCIPVVFARSVQWPRIILLGMTIVLLPSFLLTTAQDSWLAIYGFKQRVLPMALAVAAFTACWAKPARVGVLCLWLALLMVISGALAVWQTHLPLDHWLNCAPHGGPLPPEQVKAGIPRVSSTFPFFAQYSFFLIIAFPATLVAATMMRRPLNSILLLLAAIPGMAGALATASRSAVIGPMIIVFGSTVLQIIRHNFSHAIIATIFLALMATTPLLLEKALPSTVAGYNYRAEKALQRSGGNLRDLTMRIFNDSRLSSLADQTSNSWFGLGLGSQSRGTEQFSQLAASIRKKYGWQESPVRAAFIETGFWGLVTGFVMRLSLITWLLVRVFHSLSRAAVLIPFFCFASLVAIMGGMDFQFPLACWLWLAIGLLLSPLPSLSPSLNEANCERYGRA